MDLLEMFMIFKYMVYMILDFIQAILEQAL